ncbi:hypothetical protein [Frankia sp. AgB32]|uniref:hypothetical protein n=1 Tax=Frankia sp. AgB32 TaxID=631119 RepID=UPI00200F04F6|nr:hypothetical protein [Frankia sp. AgB32]MCK9896926.1 hypothetical protein [Frankia sp. AgB32]
MAIAMARILPRRPGARGRVPTRTGPTTTSVLAGLGTGAVWEAADASRPPAGPAAADGPAPGPSTAGGLLFAEISPAGAAGAAGAPGAATAGVAAAGVRTAEPGVRPSGDRSAEPAGLPRRAGGLPHELAFRDATGGRGNAIRQLWVETDEDAVLADWARRGRVELMAARRPFVLEADLDGRGVRLVEPMGRVPVAAFIPGRAGGRVRLADGTVLRWLEPTRAVFASGLVAPGGANIIRFALDGTALVIAGLDLPEPPTTRADRVLGAGPGDTCRGDAPDPRPGGVPDLVGLLVLGWFIRLLECSRPPALRSGVR